MRAGFVTLCVLGLLAAGASAQPGTPESPLPEGEAVAPPVAEEAEAALPEGEAVAPPVAEEAEAEALLPLEQPDEPAPSLLGSLPVFSTMRIHGFVSEGGFVSTSNDYIGKSSEGSLKFFEAALNVSAEPVDRLRVGLQLVSRSVGALSEEVPRIDWAVADYQWQRWLGLRAGVIKVPLGLYNEYIAIDAARTAILLPQSMYPLRNRDALQSHTGFAVYGNVALGRGGELDYQAWLGTLTIPRSALELSGGRLDSVDTRYVAGGQAFWRTPLDGLRFGATFMQASIDFHVTLDPEVREAVVAAGVAAPGYDGKLSVSQRPTRFVVASAEYLRDDWLFAAEYGRFLTDHRSTFPALSPSFDSHEERFYALASYRFSPHFELGGYYSVAFADVDDRRGRDARFEKRFHAFQRDLATTLRLDVNEYWLWKLEAHFIDGTAELLASKNPSPTRYWGLFLFRTTVTF